jgi:hypothetical protein
MIRQQSTYGYSNNSKRFDNTREYFNNNDKGFDNPHVIKINNFNIKVEIYSNNLKASKIPKIENDLKETIDQFVNSFKLSGSDKEDVIKIYNFNDKDDYEYLGGGKSFNLGLSTEGGKFYPKGPISGLPEIYVYQQGNICNLKHELTHALTYLATNGKSLPTVLAEGIADYFEHNADYKFNSQGLSIDITKNKSLSLNEILKLEYSMDGELNNLVYKTGHALVMYLQEKDPSLLSNFIASKRINNVADEKKFINKIIAHDHDFKHWLDSHDTEVVMRDMNALSVTKGEFIAVKKEVVSGESTNVSYYKANINKMNGEDVGDFSPVEHISFNKYARAIHRATNDYLDIPKEYQFLKVIKNSSGEHRLTYCDEQGNDYRDTKECKVQVFNIISKHDEQAKRVVEKFNKMNMQYKYDKEHNNVDNDYEARYWLAREKFFHKLDNVYDDINDHPQTESIVEELINVNPSLIGNILLQENRIFSIKMLGQGMTGALSVYNENGEKVGELLSEVGFFKQVEGQDKPTFVFEDILHNVNIQQDGGSYIGITRENGCYKASFIDGRKVEGDEYFSRPHLHENELLNPSIKHIKAENLDALRLNAKILSHKDSKFAQYSSEQRESGITVEKGKLLDNKGTERTDDDVYEAEIKQGGNILDIFKNVGFYISEEVKDTNGKIIRNSNLYIHDHGKNIRFSFPESITHLKLVKHEGQYKLVPCTKNGDENPEGMPDEYRYIDPIFAHEYEKRDYSHKHVNIGLINFDKYKPGTLFSIKFDPNDYHIPRNSNGEVIRATDNMIYFTKVKLFCDNQEIGMLSNNFHKFQGKIFLSADYNYSYNDFLASTSPQVHIKDMHDGSKKITFDQGRGDIEGIDRGYTDHQRVFSNVEGSSTGIHKTNDQGKGDIEGIDRGYTDHQMVFSNVEGSSTGTHKIKRSTDFKAEEIEAWLFPNKENITVDKHLTVEMKYGELVSYAADDIKQIIGAAYKTWCDKFYQQKNDNDGIAKLQLYIFKNCDDYKKYIKEFSGKDHYELWGGGTVRADEADGTIAKTFIFADLGNLSCAEFGYIMEKMSDAFLEYATGDLNKVPEVLRMGMRLFMWSHDLDKDETKFDKNYIKAAYDTLKNSKLHDVCEDYRVANCLVAFLQENDPRLISTLLSGTRSNVLDLETELKKIVDDVQIENGLKKWMFEAINYQGTKAPFSYSDTMLLAEDNIEVDIKYNAKELDSNRLDDIKDIIRGTIKDCNQIFNINNSRDLPGKINLYFCNTHDNFLQNVNKLNVHNKDGISENTRGLTKYGCGTSMDVYVYLQNPRFTETLKHELGHAVTMINFDCIAGDLPDAILEGTAQYIAGRKNGKHENNYVDIKALSTIKDENLKPDEILSNNYRGKYYYSEAEQVIKFLEDKYPDLLDGLIKDLSNSGAESKKLVKDFVQSVKTYGPEFSDWVVEQISKQDVAHSNTIVKRSLDQETVEDRPIVMKDTILKIQKSQDQDSQGKHKACVVINYNDIKSLYHKAEQTEKSAVLKVWNKLHQSNYKVGVLPVDKYYFENGTFVIKGRKYSEDEVSVKIMKLNDDFNLVLTNLQGKMISSIDKNSISSDQDSVYVTNEYDLYLTNGLDMIFNNTYDYDYDLI